MPPLRRALTAYPDQDALRACGRRPSAVRLRSEKPGEVEDRTVQQKTREFAAPSDICGFCELSVTAVGRGRAPAVARGRTGSLSLSGDIDLDRPRPGFLTQRQPHGEDTLFVLGRDLIGVDGLRQRERAAERAVAPLHAMELILLGFTRQLLLAFDRERPVVDGDVDVLARHVGEL